MLYKWMVKDADKNPPIRELDISLRKIGMRAEISSYNDINFLIIETPETGAHIGRPRAAVSGEDLTLSQILHCRFLNVPMENIARKMGISKRTLYRRLDSISRANLDPDTPFSKWP